MAYVQEGAHNHFNLLHILPTVRSRVEDQHSSNLLDALVGLVLLLLVTTGLLALLLLLTLLLLLVAVGLGRLSLGMGGLVLVTTSLARLLLGVLLVA